MRRTYAHWTTDVQRVVTWLVGLALAIFLLGASVVPLTIPAFTRIVASRTSLARDAGLSQERILQIAERVREFVVDSDAPSLPSTVDGRAGFDEQAVSHLLDVRRVLAASRIATGVLALVLALGLAFEVARRRTNRIADALSAGAVSSVVLVALCGLAATVNFETFFAVFHGLFFAAGTWTFPYDSLLIQTFPELFWASAGGAWAVLVLTGAGLLSLCGRVLRRGQTGAGKRIAEPRQ